MTTADARGCCPVCSLDQVLCFNSPHVSRQLMTIYGYPRRVFCSSRRRIMCLKSSTAGPACSFMENAQTLWDFLRIDDPLEKSDLILVLGNSDLRTADYAAQLYHEGLAPFVAVSGRAGHKTKGKWTAPEAVVFSQHLLERNVPVSQIILETKATNTGENIRFTQALLRGLPDTFNPSSIILVQTPLMGRRSYATFKQQWEKSDTVAVSVTSPPIPLSHYASEDAGYVTIMDVAAEMVRNMQRILHYPTLGFQITQHVPPHVMEAYKSLLSFCRKTDPFRDL